MRNIILLTKNYALCALGTMRGKKSRLKSWLGALFLTLITALIFGLLLFTQIMTAEMYAAAGLQKLVLFSGFIMGIFLAVIFAFQKVTGGQKANDAELLLAMPFKKSEIVIAKALSRYLFNLALCCLLVVPSIIAYMIYTPFSLVTLIGNIFILLIIPMCAVGLSYIVDFITAICFKNNKLGNITKALFTLVALIAFTVVYEVMILNTENSPMLFLIDDIITFNPWFMSIAIAVGLLIFGTGIYLSANMLTRELKDTRHRTTKLVSKTTTPFKSLLKNEVNRYTNSTALMINTLIGPIAIIGITIWLMIDRGKTLANLCLTFGLTPDLVTLVIAMMWGFMVIMTYPSAFAISLEGKQFWILKSMPIPAYLVLLAKGLFTVFFVSPILLVCSLLLTLVIKMPLINFLVLLLLPIALNVVIAFGGLFVNLLFPKFEFESEATVIKQSMSSLIMMLLGMAIQVLIIILLITLIKNGMATLWLLLIPLLSVIAIAIITVVLTFTVGTRIFKRL